jgi:hypothetical protein
VTVSQVEIEGEEAAAEVAIEGGTLGGQAIAVGLQEEEATAVLRKEQGRLRRNHRKLPGIVGERP